MTGIGEITLAQPVKPPLRERRACLAKLVKNRLTLTDGMGGLSETLEEALGSTVVVEYESGGDGGAFEVGTAPAGSAELERLIAAARSEADALASAGGWAAVRVGFGDAETIDCETGRTVYTAGAE